MLKLILFPLNLRIQTGVSMAAPSPSTLVRRFRRLRGNPTLRRLVREHATTVDDLIYPLFVRHGAGLRQPIASMPGQYQLSIDRLVDEIGHLTELGIPAVILFGIPERKDSTGLGACEEDGIVQRAVRAIKQQAPDLVVITDVCFCEYTDHGHCGPLTKVQGRVDVDNDATLSLIAEQARSHAQRAPTWSRLQG